MRYPSLPQKDSPAEQQQFAEQTALGRWANPDELAYYVVFGPADTGLATLARVAGHRWKVEECFEAAKQEVGLDGYEIRSWHGWYRQITLSMLALAFLAVMRIKLAPQKGADDPPLLNQLLSVCPRSVA